MGMTSFPKPSDSTSIADLLDLRGKTAVVTGGAMGIGYGIVKRLHEAGANVVIADINAEALKKAAATFGDDDRIAVATGDVSKREDADAFVEAAVERFGGLDIFVNNAGIYPFGAFLDVDLETARRTIEVNLLGVYACSQAAARQMIAQGRGGKIITVSSVESVNPTVEGLAHYGASKHGVWGLLKTMMLELARHGIAVNTVAPGAIRTAALDILDAETLAAVENVTPMQRIGEPDDIGRAVLFFASDLASFVNGARLVVDGGRVFRGAGVSA